MRCWGTGAVSAFFTLSLRIFTTRRLTVKFSHFSVKEFGNPLNKVNKAILIMLYVANNQLLRSKRYITFCFITVKY